MECARFIREKSCAKNIWNLWECRSTRLLVTAARVNEIVREQRGVSPDTALRLSRYFGTTPEFWLNLQMSYELRKVAQEQWANIIEEIVPLEMAA
jgi:addiction module HigA family antidote